MIINEQYLISYQYRNVKLVDGWLGYKCKKSAPIDHIKLIDEPVEDWLLRHRQELNSFVLDMPKRNVGKTQVEIVRIYSVFILAQHSQNFSPENHARLLTASPDWYMKI